MPLHFAQFSEYAGTWISILLSFSLKGAVIIGVAGLLVLMMRRASAASRHLVWNMSLAALLALPLLSLVMPAWRVAVLPEVNTATKTEQPEVESSRDIVTHAPLHEAEEAKRAAIAIAEKSVAPTSAIETSQSPIKDTKPANDSSNTIAQTESAPLGWQFWALMIWLAGALVVALRMLIGTISVWWIVRKAEPVEDDSWISLMEFLVWQLELKRPARLLESRSISMPITCGMFRSVVLIPQGAGEWAEERRQVVLSHELAHVKRRDCLTQMLAQLACALYWFNPLIWIAARRLRVERELACDDYVLSTGTRASDYAGHLLDLARTMRSAHLSSLTAVAIARRSQLEGRLLAILDPGLKRRGLNRVSTAIVAIVLACIVLPLSALRPTTRAEASSEKSKQADSLPQPNKSSVDLIGNVDHLTTAVTVTSADKEKSAKPDDEDKDEDQSADIDAEAEQESANQENQNQNKNQSSDMSKDAIADGVAGAVAAILTNQDNKDAIKQTAIEGLKEALKDEDPNVRKQAMRALGIAGGSDVVPIMIAALKDKDAETRKQAAWVLGMKGNRDSIDPLIEALKDENAGVREQSAWALGLRGDNRVVDPLINALKDSVADVRERSAWALGLKGDQRAIDPLIAALKDSQPNVREQAAWALGLKGDNRAIDELIKALSDSSSQVREQAAWALGLKGDSRIVDPLINALKDPSANVREQAAHGLGLRGDARAVSALNAALKDTNKDVRERAAWALGMLLVRSGGK